MTLESKSRGQLKSLQVLRCFAFMGVFLSHAHFNPFRITGSWGVSIFIILSGFLMSFNYWGQNKIQNVSVKYNFLFAKRKIDKLYSLHIITTLALALFMVVGSNVTPIRTVLIKLTANFLLIQMWFPKHLSINGVAWYLCAYVFFCFMFPWVLKVMENGYSRRKAFICIGCAAAVSISGGAIVNQIALHFTSDPDQLEIYAVKWFSYYFPVSRFWEFLIGCNLGYLFLTREHTRSGNTYTVLEIATTVFTIATIVIASCYTLPFTPERMAVYPKYWWLNIQIFILSSSLIIYVFAIGKGKLSRWLSCKAVLEIARISPYAYLIHYVIFRYIDRVFMHIPVADSNLAIYKYGRWIQLTLGFALTVLLSYAWMKAVNIFRQRRIKV